MRATILAAVVFAAGLATAAAQMKLWSDDFEDDRPEGWIKGVLGQIAEADGQLIVSGTFGPTPSYPPTATYAYAVHSIPTSGPLLEQQTLEAQVDLAAANQDGVFAHLQLVWYEGAATRAYALAKGHDKIALMKGWAGGDSCAFFFATNSPAKTQNITLALALTRLGSDVRIRTRVLDKDQGGAVLFDRTVTDTPQSDPSIPSGSDLIYGLMADPDPEETPWPIGSAPGTVELGLAWESQDPSDGVATVSFDHLEVWQFEPPQLAVRNGGQAVEVSWPGLNSQFVLESASNVEGPWAPIANLSPGTIPGRTELNLQTSPGQTFFRVHEGPSQECACDPSWYNTAPPAEAGLPLGMTLADILPAEYYDSEVVGADFLAPLAGLQSLVPPGLQALSASAKASPWSSLGPSASDLGVIEVFFARHLRNEHLAPYDETIVRILVEDPSNGLTAWYSPAMTVTTKEAQWGGLAAYGYPKIMGEVRVQSVATNRIECLDAADGERILKLSVSTAGMSLGSGGPVTMVSAKGGYLVRANWVTTGTVSMSSSSNASTIELGENHPVARQLRAAGVGGNPSIRQFRGVHLQITGYAGTCRPL